MQKKYVVVTGGVLSGLGKGIAMASIGNLLSSMYKVVPIKCDGYLNVDPGTMNPVEHGEVFVLDDKGEVDMDFGHYERFLGTVCTTDSNLTMGKVFHEILNSERRGDYLGQTVQFIPHVTDWIENYFVEVGEKNNADITMIEIGGTIGDIENELYIHSVRNLSNRLGKKNVLFAHVTYVPTPYGVNEQKSKPTQQSVSSLLQRGIQPDIIIARCSEMLEESVRKKISSFGNVGLENIITGVDVDDVYKIPLIFEEQGMSQLIARKLDIPVRPELEEWRQLVSNRENADKEINVAIAGKYTRLEDSYASIVESLNHCSAHYSTRINVKWVDTEKESINPEKIDGVIVPGGFGSRGTEGMIDVVRKCREGKIPYLGICFGLQMAVVEFARNVCGKQGANSTEIDRECNYPVIDILDEQRELTDKGGNMRLGAQKAVLQEGSLVSRLYNSSEVSERHRHRYEVNPNCHSLLKDKGLIFSGMSPDRKLVEFIELPETVHPYFVATQAHPELKSSLFRPAPLFKGFVEAALKRKSLGYQ